MVPDLQVPDLVEPDAADHERQGAAMFPNGTITFPTVRVTKPTHSPVTGAVGCC